MKLLPLEYAVIAYGAVGTVFVFAAPKGILRYAFASWLLLAVLSCAPQPTIIKLLPDDFSRLRTDEPIYVVHTEHDALFVWDPRMATGGGLGFLVFGSLAEREGNKIARENSLQDPVYVLKDRFLTGLANNYGVRNFKVVEQTRKDGDDKVDKLRADFKDGNVLEFKTTASAIVPIEHWFSNEWKYTYAAELRLIRLSDGRTLWQQQCTADGKPLAKKDMLIADGAKILKSDMLAAAEDCAKQLLAKFSQ